jgi:putative Holliday junction resolvase
MVYLGIDYGRAKVGLAISEGFLAQPLVVLPNGKKLLGKISSLVQQQRVKKIIIGLPEGNLKEEIKIFGQKLKKLASLPIEFEPESLTTQEAVVKMIEAGKGKKARREKKDAFAAALILQSYLDKKTQSHV